MSRNYPFIHNIPVKQGLVFRPEYYIYSSAIDYSGEKGILDNVLLLNKSGKSTRYNRAGAFSPKVIARERGIIKRKRDY